MKAEEAKEWRASSTGPDWTDIAMTLRELEKLHQVWISLRVLNGGSRHSNGLRIIAAAFTNVLVVQGETGIVTQVGEWPNKDTASLEGTVYRLLLELDHKLSATVWEQAKLPGT